MKYGARFSRIDIDHIGIVMLHRDRMLGEQMLHWAEEAAVFAVGLAPYRTGHYMQDIFAERGHGLRVNAIYGSRDFKAHWIESGTSRPTRAQHPLIRAGRAAGLRIHDLRGL